MTSKKKTAETAELLKAVLNGISEKKGQNPAVIDLRKTGNSISDYYVVCHGSSNTNVSAIAESVVDEVRIKTGDKPRHLEGKREAEWIVVDFFDVVVHVFQEEYRNHYEIEELWADADIKYIEENS